MTFFKKKHKKKSTKKKTSPKTKHIPQKLDHSDSSKNPASAAGGGLGGAGGASNAEGWCRSAQCRATLQELTNAVHHRRDRGVPWGLGFKKTTRW